MGNWFTSMCKSDSRTSEVSASTPSGPVDTPVESQASSTPAPVSVPEASPVVPVVATLVAPAVPEAPKKIDPKSLMCFSLKDQVIFRAPGSIRGNEFLIDDCKNCDFYICDNTAQITVDGCVNCRFFFGPCEASLFMRDCTQSTVVAACQQLRLRNCTEMRFALFCGTEPVIESSKSLQFGCFQFAYFSLAEQFTKAGLNIWTNEWFRIHDFTPSTNGTSNYSYMSAAESSPAVLLSGVSLHEASAGVFDVNELMPQSPSLVPLVVGSKQSSDQSASFLLLCGPDVSALASTVTVALSQQSIRRTRMITLTCEQATMLLSAAGTAVQKGNLNELLKSNSAVAFDLRGDSPCDQSILALLDSHKSAAALLSTLQPSVSLASMFFDDFKPKVF